MKAIEEEYVECVMSDNMLDEELRYEREGGEKILSSLLKKIGRTNVKIYSLLDARRTQIAGYVVRRKEDLSIILRRVYLL